MSCKFTTNGLSLSSAQSFCKFISDCLYDTFKIKTDVSLEKGKNGMFFVLKNKNIKSLCDFLTLEFSDLILFDGRYYVGKGPRDEYVAKINGYDITFFNWYIFCTEDVVLRSEDSDNTYTIYSSDIKLAREYVNSLSGNFIFSGESGIVFSANLTDPYYSKKIDQTDSYQKWIRNL